MSQRIVGVSALVRYLKGKLDQDGMIQRITVQGEISNFTNHRSGHWYFTLKDENSRISCVMFQSSAKQCAFIPKEGDKVLLTANTSLFEASGQLQLYGLKMQLDGLGQLYMMFEALKKKLANEGLFDERRKKQIPDYPMKIGVVSGSDTAAYHDVISTIQRRWPIATVSLFPCLVQGENAPNEIIDALSNADNQELDVILLVRGGGSIEDLWAFNNEELARHLTHLRTPVIAGVGHEVDVTIVDYVADLRAPTPTGAAEMATPNLEDVLARIHKEKDRLLNAQKRKIEFTKERLRLVQSKRFFTDPSSFLEASWMRLDTLDSKLKSSMKILEVQRFQFEQKKNRMSQAVLKRSHLTQQALSIDLKKLQNNLVLKMRERKENYARSVAMLDAYSPLKSLSRGYSLTLFQGKVINSVDSLHPQDSLTIRLVDGIVKGRVEKIVKGENHERRKDI